MGARKERDERRESEIGRWVDIYLFISNESYWNI